MGIDDEGEPCDFCELPLGEGEHFTEVRLGPLPQPDRLRIEKIGAPYRREKPRQAQHRLIVEALEEDPQFEVRTSNVVEEVQAVGGEMHYSTDRDLDISRTQFETRTHNDKVAGSVMVFPEPEEQEPDAELCPRCAEMFE